MSNWERDIRRHQSDNGSRCFLRERKPGRMSAIIPAMIAALHGEARVGFVTWRELAK